MSILFPYTLTSSLGGLQFPKVDLNPVPNGANLNQYLSSSDWNQTQQACVELALGITSGSLFGFQRFLVAPTGSAGPNGNFTDFIWLSASGQLMQHVRNGTDQNVGGGGGSGLSYVPSLSASYVAASNVSGNVLPLTVGQGPFGLTARYAGSAGAMLSVQSGSSTFFSVNDSGSHNFLNNTPAGAGSRALVTDTLTDWSGQTTAQLFTIRNAGADVAFLSFPAASTIPEFRFAGNNGGLRSANGDGLVIQGANNVYLYGAAIAQVNWLANNGMMPVRAGLYNGQPTVSNFWSATYSQHYAGAGSAPSGTLGGGAGSGGSYTISGSDSAHMITLAVGTAPTANDVILTGTFNSAFAAAPNGVTLTPANAAAAAALSGVYVDATYVYNHAGSGYALRGVGAALTPSTTFKWFVEVIA